MRIQALSHHMMKENGWLKFTVYEDLFNVANFYTFLIVIFLLTYCKVTHLLFFVSVETYYYYH